MNLHFRATDPTFASSRVRNITHDHLLMKQMKDQLRHGLRLTDLLHTFFSPIFDCTNNFQCRSLVPTPCCSHLKHQAPCCVRLNIKQPQLSLNITLGEIQILPASTRHQHLSFQSYRLMNVRLSSLSPHVFLPPTRASYIVCAT